MQDLHLSMPLRLFGGSGLPAFLNLCLIAVGAWLLAGLTWQFVPAAPDSATASSKASASTNSAAPQRQLSTEIARHHLFGEAQAVQAKAVDKPVVAPDTKLNLQLRGVLAYDPQASALAIISEGRGTEGVFAVGDELPGSATLEEVHPDRVILKRNGQLETLRLPEESTPQVVASTQTGNQRGGDQQIANLSPRELRDSIVKDPMQFARKVRTIPHKENGQLVGYKLRAREYQDVLSQYGLEPNDIITAVNGTALNNPETSLRALRSLATAREINATVLRDGVETPVFVSLE